MAVRAAILSTIAAAMVNKAWNVFIYNGIDLPYIVQKGPKNYAMHFVHAHLTAKRIRGFQKLDNTFIS